MGWSRPNQAGFLDLVYQCNGSFQRIFTISHASCREVRGVAALVDGQLHVGVDVDLAVPELEVGLLFSAPAPAGFSSARPARPLSRKFSTLLCMDR